MVTGVCKKYSDDFLYWGARRVVVGLILICGLVLLSSCREMPKVEEPVVDSWKKVLGHTDTEDLGPDATQFQRRVFFGAVAMNDRLWVVGGQDTPWFNDVWNSEDGITWEKQLEGTDSPGMDQFSRRQSFGLDVMRHEDPLDSDGQDEMFLVGGLEQQSVTGTPGKLKNDVWKSSDGKTWEQIIATGAIFSERQGFGFTIDSDGQMWVIGGEDNIGPLNDVWMSDDGGKVWKEIKSNNVIPEDTDFTRRGYFG